MGLLNAKLAIREACEWIDFTKAAIRIEQAAYHVDMDDMTRYCRYCGIAQNHPDPDHQVDCPVIIVALMAEKLSGERVAE